MNTSSTASLGRGAVAGLAGTAVMTAFQRLIEMPLSGRGDSDAPAAFAERVLPLQPSSGGSRELRNTVAHFALGTMWGVAHAVAASRGLRGQRAVGAVFTAVYTADLAVNTALGLYRPSTWSRRDWVIDVVDKLVQAQATGLVFERGPGAA